ncbi:MAG: hypothetical protein ACE5HQ_09570 [Gemmatimonadota bacterium]
MQRDTVQKYRRTFRIALLVSLGLHVAVLAYARLHLPAPATRDAGLRPAERVAADRFRERPLEVVNVRVAGSRSSSRAEAAPVAERRAPGARTDASSRPFAALAMAGELSGAPALEVRLAARITPVSLPISRRRGVVLRRDRDRSGGARGVTFQPASQAARNAAGRRGGGRGGIGVVISGMGGDCAPGAGPVIGPTGVIPAVLPGAGPGGRRGGIRRPRGGRH